MTSQNQFRILIPDGRLSSERLSCPRRSPLPSRQIACWSSIHKAATCSPSSVSAGPVNPADVRREVEARVFEMRPSRRSDRGPGNLSEHGNAACWMWNRRKWQAESRSPQRRI